MILSLGNGQTFERPTADQIEAALARLDGGGDSFAILAIDEQTYVQTSGGSTTGFILEHQDGSVERHFQSLRNNLPLDLVSRVFRLFAERDDAWRSAVEWQLEDLDRPSPESNRLWVMLATVVFFAALVWWVSTG